MQIQQNLSKEEDPALPTCHFVAARQLFSSNPSGDFPSNQPSVAAKAVTSRENGMAGIGLAKHSGSVEEGVLHEQNWDFITKERGRGVGPATGNVTTYFKIYLREISKHKGK